MKRRTVGTGITQHEITEYETIEEGMAAAKDLVATFVHPFDQAEQFCSAILREADLRDAGDNLEAVVINHGKNEPDSDVGYAARILTVIGHIRYAKADHNQLGYQLSYDLHVLELGRLTQEWAMKKAYEKAAIRGTKGKTATDKGGAETKRQWQGRHEQMLSMFNELLASGLTKTKAREEIAARFEYRNAESVRNALAGEKNTA